MFNARLRTIASLTAAAAVVGVSAALAWAADSVYQQRVLRERELLRAESDAQRSLRSAREQLELAQHMSSRYRALQDAGLFDPIDKPVAIDRAEAALRPYAAAVTRYQIGGSRETVHPPLDRSGQFQIDIERVVVDFEPLHEERFLHVWDAISSLRGPAGSIESCELHRPVGQSSGARTGSDAARKVEAPAPLAARCLLTWYRLRAAPASEAAAPTATPSRSKRARS